MSVRGNVMPLSSLSSLCLHLYIHPPSSHPPWTEARHCPATVRQGRLSSRGCTANTASRVTATWCRCCAWAIMDFNVNSPSSSAPPAMSYTYPSHQQQAQQLTPPQFHQRWSAPGSALPQLANVDQFMAMGAARKRRRSTSSGTTERADGADFGMDFPPPSVSALYA